jgi:sugar phosphate isomerase/epimerase
MAKPRFSVSQITTFHQTFDEDLASYAAAGVEGVGIWQFKLPEDGNDREALAKLKDSGLKATTMIPGTLSIHPVPFPGPDDPAERTEELCATIRRFAPFEPEVVLVLPGAPAAGSDPDEARRVTVEGFRKAAKVAAEYGLTLGMEPLHREIYGTWTTVYTIPQTIDLIDEIGEPNVQVLYDVYHLHDTDNVLEDTVKYGSRISPSIHICDWREVTRNDFDRVLPGDGIIDLEGIFGALDAAADPRWVDLEIFSDDGSFSEMDFEDSLWKQPAADVLARAKAGFDKAWAARRPPA